MCFSQLNDGGTPSWARCCIINLLEDVLLLASLALHKDRVGSLLVLFQGQQESALCQKISLQRVLWGLKSFNEDLCILFQM